MGLKLSIVICTYNRAEYLRNALASLSNQSLHKDDYEVVVVNNNSTDRTEEESLLFKNKHPEINFQYTVESKQGLSYARNKGIIVSRGTYISFIDDDAVASSIYAESIVSGLDTHEDFAALGGRVIPFFENDIELKWLSKYVWGMVAKVDYGSEVKPFKKKYPPGCNMAFRKDVFEKTGYFDTELANRCDDRYIFGQLKRHRLKVLYYPEAAVNHFIPEKRVTEEGIVRLSKLNGSEHRKLLKGSFLNVTLKFFDYLLKLVLAVVLSVGFILKGEPEKSKIIKIMYYSLIGFMSGKN